MKLYQEILQSPNGALVWSFLKPIIHGKILYTPNTPEMNKVIQKVSPANEGLRGHTSNRVKILTITVMRLDDLWFS